MKNEELNSIYDVYDYLFLESRHSKFWIQYHKDVGFDIELSEMFGVFFKSPFLVQPNFNLTKEWDDYVVNLLKTKMERFKEDNSLFLIESQYRTEFLLKYLKENSRKLKIDKINDLIIDCWVSTEFPSMQREMWNEIFGYFTQNTSHLNDLPSGLFEIFRGGDAYGRSWTMCKRKAIWFAKRFCQEGDEFQINMREVTREDVLFFTNSRGEKEVVLKDFSQPKTHQSKIAA